MARVCYQRHKKRRLPSDEGSGASPLPAAAGLSIIRLARDDNVLPAFRRRCLFVRAALCARPAQCPPAGHDQPSATRINAVASMPAKNAPIIGKAAINFARCERGPPSAHAARRHGSKYFLQSHAAVHPPINERMNNKPVMLNL